MVGRGDPADISAHKAPSCSLLDVTVVQHEALEAHRDELERHVAADAAAPDDSDG